MEAPEGLEIMTEGALLQMILENDARLEPNGRSHDFVELGEADVPEMVELATLTKPGPFATRTREMGTYLEIRKDGRLVAMAGERLKLPGYTEISAVCTHPEHLGHGYAGFLMTVLGEPFASGGKCRFCMCGRRMRGLCSFMSGLDSGGGCCRTSRCFGRARVEVRQEPSAKAHYWNGVFSGALTRSFPA
jgi:hypothetical protein